MHIFLEKFSSYKFIFHFLSCSIFTCRFDMTNPFLCLFHRDGNGPEETNLTEPLVTFPDPDTPPPVSDAVTLTGGSPSQLSSLNSLNNLHHGINQPINIPNIANLPAGQETMKFEQKKMTSASKTKVSTFLSHIIPPSLRFLL